MRRVIALFLLSFLSGWGFVYAQQVEKGDYVYTSDEDVVDRGTVATRSIYTIQGIIRDAENTPIPNIQVMLQGNDNVLSTYTNEIGWYQFSNVVGGTSYTVMPTRYEAIGVIDTSTVSGTTIVAIAQNEIGQTDGPSPGRYHGHDGGWCSEFVSWVYWQAGDPFIGGSGDGGACTEEWNMSTVHRVIAGFGRRDEWQVLSIEEINAAWQDVSNNPLQPQAGDYVFFSNTSGIDRSHSGLVKDIQGTTMYTVEGNVSNLVQALTRSNWRTYQDGNTIVKGIGYRRIVSNISFTPRFFYGYINANSTVNFTLSRIDNSTSFLLWTK